MFGDERLTAIVQEHSSLHAAALADRVMAEISEFQAGAEHFDDETLIVLRVNDAAAPTPVS